MPVFFRSPLLKVTFINSRFFTKEELLTLSLNYFEQIGEQDLAFGLKFNAKGIVDCYENALESIPSELGGQTLRRDIDFNMVEGDFEIFRGKWSLQQVPLHCFSAFSSFFFC